MVQPTFQFKQQQQKLEKTSIKFWMQIKQHAGMIYNIVTI